MVIIASLGLILISTEVLYIDCLSRNQLRRLSALYAVLLENKNYRLEQVYRQNIFKASL